VDLVRALETVAGMDRIRISSIEPTTITWPLLEHMAGSTKLCHYLHIPLQSGDDEILRAMNRQYQVRDYVALVERAFQLMPDLGLGTDLLVGFPGEDDCHYANTLSLAADLPFAYFHVFRYSERPGTAAARLHDTVRAEAVQTRSKELADLSRTKRLAVAQTYVGRRVEVLFESREEQGYWTGLTKNYLRVGVPAAQSLKNRLLDVTITGAMDGLAVAAPLERL
ncbi:MAG: radical SAM protein, partial [Nitrospirae bacterium]|nr:radical SAM protein [Nitrospirota bacterium]